MWIANPLFSFEHYSSAWLLPTGATLAIVMIAPGFMKIAPIFCALLLWLPPVRTAFGLTGGDADALLAHMAVLYFVGAGVLAVLARDGRIGMPMTLLGDVQRFIGGALVAITLAVALGTAITLWLGASSIEGALGMAVPLWFAHAVGAMAVTPLLLPALITLFARSAPDWRWPRPRRWVLQAGASLLALALAGLAAQHQLIDGDYWCIAIVPPLVFALRSGVEEAASSVFLANVQVPVLAQLTGYEGNLLVLCQLLLVASVASLLIGAAISEKRQTLAEIELRVDQRTRQLQNAYEFQRHLIRSIGHDLRQPVEAMNMMLEAVTYQTNAEAIGKALGRMRQIGALSSQLLSKIMTYARLDAGKLKPMVASFAVADLFGRLQVVYAPIAELRGVRTTWSHAHQTIVSDEDLLTQVLSNHLDNAIRLSGAGQTVSVAVTTISGGHEFLIMDEIAETVVRHPGAAGFGTGIVFRISQLLGADLIQDVNRRGIFLPLKRR